MSGWLCFCLPELPGAYWASVELVRSPWALDLDVVVAISSFRGRPASVDAKDRIQAADSTLTTLTC